MDFNKFLSKLQKVIGKRGININANHDSSADIHHGTNDHLLHDEYHGFLDDSVTKVLIFPE